MMMIKTYLGDGVYIQIAADGEVTLTTEDGVNVTNRIVLEPTVLAHLQEYIKKYVRTIK